MKLKAAVFLAALACAPTPSLAESPSPALLGAPVTEATLVDRAELIRLADALDAAVDAKDWEAARSLFADEIAVDFTSLIGGAPAVIPADALIAGWSANLTSRKKSFHLRGNYRATFGGDEAVLLSHGYAWNWLETGAAAENGGDPFWEVWGVYEHRFTKTEDGWRISGMALYVSAERGNPFVRDTTIAD